MKEMWREFKTWVNYIRDYSYNKIDLELLDGERKENQKERQRLIKKINNEVINKKLIEQEKDDLIAKIIKRNDILGTELSNTKKRNNELRNTISMLYRQNQDLQSKVDEKELLRRKKAGAIGGLKATITKHENKIAKLEKELERANQKITWLKNNQKAPTKEEILAYEMRMKEVEKRQKQK